MSETSRVPAELASNRFRLRNPALVDLKGFARAAGYALLGSIGSIALSIPLYGYLAYWASLLYSLLIGWPFFGLAIGLGRGSRWSRLYLSGRWACWLVPGSRHSQP